MRLSAARNLKEYEDPNNEKTFPESEEWITLLSLLLREMADENLSLKTENAKLKEDMGPKNPRATNGILY